MGTALWQVLGIELRSSCLCGENFANVIVLPAFYKDFLLKITGNTNSKIHLPPRPDILLCGMTQNHYCKLQFLVLCFILFLNSIHDPLSSHVCSSAGPTLQKLSKEWAGHSVPLVECLPAVQETLDSLTAPHSPGMVAHRYNPSPLGAEAGRGRGDQQWAF